MEDNKALQQWFEGLMTKIQKEYPRKPLDPNYLKECRDKGCKWCDTCEGFWDK